MGYCMDLVGSDFVIKKEHHEAALSHIKGMTPYSPTTPGNGFSDAGATVHFAWMNNHPNFDVFETLVEALTAWRFEPTLNEEGDIVSVSFIGGKIGDENYVWDAIAEFVEAGSFIEMRGEDGEQWRWNFDGQKWHTAYGKVTYD